MTRIASLVSIPLLGVLAASSPARADRYAYILDRDAGLISAINVDRAKMTAQLALNAPAGAALSRDGRTLFVAESSSETVAVVAVPALTLVKRVAVGIGAEGVALDSMGDDVVVVHKYDQVATFSADLPPDQYEHRIDMGAAGATAVVNQPTRDRLYVAYQGGGLGTIDPVNLTGSIDPTGGLPYATDLASYDDSEVHGVLIADGSKLIFAVPGHAPITLVSTDRPRAVASSPVVFGSAPIWVAFAGGVVKQLGGATWTVGRDPRGLAYSDDEDPARSESSLVVANRGSSTATVINVASNVVRTVGVSPTPSRVVAGTILRSAATVPPASLVYLNTKAVVKTISVLNQSEEPLLITGVSFVGSTRFAVTLDGCAGKTVPIGGACAVTVRFTADTPGPTFSGTLKVTTAWPNLAATGTITARYGVISF